MNGSIVTRGGCVTSVFDADGNDVTENFPVTDESETPAEKVVQGVIEAINAAPPPTETGAKAAAEEAAKKVAQAAADTAAGYDDDDDETNPDAS